MCAAWCATFRQRSGRIRAPRRSSPAQNRGLREDYVKATVSAHIGTPRIQGRRRRGFRLARRGLLVPHHGPLPASIRKRRGVFSFPAAVRTASRPAFVQDLVRLGNWTFSAGLRFDHYRLVVDESAFSPRLGVAWYWPAAGLVLRASYDRVFQTPAFENILLASSAAVDSLNDNVLRLPVHPSHGNFYEAGLAKGILGKLRLEANYFRRTMDDFADDDLLLNTGVSFPIAFRRAEIYGTEVKLEIPRWGPLSGYLSYSNLLGRGYLPVTGGLFLGDESAGLLGSEREFSNHPGPAQHRARPLSLRGDAARLVRSRRQLRQRPAGGIRRYVRGCAGAVRAAHRQPREFRSRPGAAFVCAGRIGGSGAAQEGKADCAAAGGRAESDRSPERAGFRGCFFWDRVGCAAQRVAAAAGGVVGMTVGKAFCPVLGGIAFLGALYAFQMPFREYPGMEYNDFPKPPDWEEKTEWAFARLMYPQTTGYGRGFGAASAAATAATAAATGCRDTPCGPRIIRAPTATSRRPSAA